MDYYQLSNDLRFQCQLLKKYSTNVFEIALNASILSENVTLSHSNNMAIGPISQMLGPIAKEMGEGMKVLLKNSSSICRNTLEIKKNYIIFNNLKIGLTKVEDQSNQSIVIKTLDNMKNQIYLLGQEAIIDLSQLKINVKKVKKLNEKVWVAINNIKIEMASNEYIRSFEYICKQLDEINQNESSIILTMHQYIDTLIKILENEIRL